MTRDGASPSSHSSFCEEVFSRPSRTGTYQRFGFAAQTRTQFLQTGSSVTLANEVERSEYSGSWLSQKVESFQLRVEKKKPLPLLNLSTTQQPNNLHPSSRLHRLRMLSE